MIGVSSCYPSCVATSSVSDLLREQLRQLFLVTEIDGVYWLGGPRGTKALFRVPSEESLAQYLDEGSSFSTGDQMSLIAQDIEALCASGSVKSVALMELTAEGVEVVAEGLDVQEFGRRT